MLSTVEPTSLFSRFVTDLRTHWKTRLPGIEDLSGPNEGSLSPTESFRAGTTRAGLTLYLNLQRSSKYGHLGEFTVNIVLAGPEGRAPDTAAYSIEGTRLPVGSYRLGSVLYARDKWWHLTEEDGSPLRLNWRPSSYLDPERVLEEAVGDVTTDVARILDMLGVQGD
jgi:hypothetical protein